MTDGTNDIFLLSNDMKFRRNNDTNKIFMSYNNSPWYEIYDIIFSDELLEGDLSFGNYLYSKGKMTKIIGSAYLYFTVEAKRLMDVYIERQLSSSYATELFNFLRK